MGTLPPIGVTTVTPMVGEAVTDGASEPEIQLNNTMSRNSDINELLLIFNRPTTTP